MRGKRYDGHHFCCIIGNNVIVDRQVHDLGIKQKSVIELDASRKERGYDRTWMAVPVPIITPQCSEQLL